MVELSTVSLCSSFPHINSPILPKSCLHPIPFLHSGFFNSSSFNHKLSTKRKSSSNGKQVEKEELSDPSSVPSWANLDSDEPPPWARDEAQKGSSSNFEVPFFVYLLASAITAIAAIGSIFEYVNRNPVFGVLNSDSAFYAPLLGFFAFTGIPTSAYLWFKSVQVANKEAEEQDRRDGYL